VTAAKHFRKIFSTKNLRRIYGDRVEDTRATGLDRINPASIRKRLAGELDIVKRKVATQEYRFTPFKEKLISKGATSAPRVISIPTARDRIVLRALCDLLQTVFPSSVPTIPQVKVEALQGALASSLYAEFVKIDLQNFYPSIPQQHLLATLRKKIRKKEILHLIESAIKTPTVSASKGGSGATPNLQGVPQGLAISNILAEIAIGEIDRAYASRPDIWYSRYVDDILILCKTGDGASVAQAIVAQLKAIGLRAHAPGEPNSKSRVGTLAEGFSYLGYHVQNDTLSIRPESIRKFEGSLASIFTAYRHRANTVKTAADKQLAIDVCRWRLNLRITGCIFKERRLGWVFYFSQITDTTRLRSVDSTIATLLKRFSLISEIKPKTLIKTHYESKRHDKSTHKYIVNFDAMDVVQKREILALFIKKSVLSKLSDKRIAQLFEMRISAAVKELEADLAGTS
jgi:RNA-directed DNA polymerase